MTNDSTTSSPTWTLMVTDKIGAMNITHFPGDNGVSLLAYNLQGSHIWEVNMDRHVARALIDSLQSAVDYADMCEDDYGDGTPGSERRRLIQRKRWERHPSNFTPAIQEG